MLEEAGRRDWLLWKVESLPRYPWHSATSGDLLLQFCQLISPLLHSFLTIPFLVFHIQVQRSFWVFLICIWNSKPICVCACEVLSYFLSHSPVTVFEFIERCMLCSEAATVCYVLSSWGFSKSSVLLYSVMQSVYSGITCLAVKILKVFSPSWDFKKISFGYFESNSF